MKEAFPGMNVPGPGMENRIPGMEDSRCKAKCAGLGVRGSAGEAGIMVHQAARRGTKAESRFSPPEDTGDFIQFPLFRDSHSEVFNSDYVIDL
jgi:hypothetical protein